MRAALLALGLLAMTGSAAIAQSVGVASAVNQSALGTSPGQVPKTVYMGDQIIHNQKIVTDSKGLLQILLADGTSFTVGPNSSLTIDSFVYDPDKGTAKVVADLGTGLFRFIGGASSKTPDGVTLNTPVGTVGVRGGISNLDFSGAVAYHIDMVYGDGVTLTDGTKVVGDLYKSGYSIVFGANGKVSIEKTPPEWSQIFQTALAGSGKGGTVKGNQVSGNLKGTNNTGNPQGNSNDQGQTQVASDEGPVTTWAQVDNSSLKGVDAYYTGKYAATVTGDSEMVNEIGSNAAAGVLPFKLDYHFATGDGTMYFGEYPNGDATVDSALVVPVGADAFGTGLASFSHSGTLPNPDGQIGDYPYETGSASLNGLFLNSNLGIGGGVVGAFSASVSGGEDGSYAFSNGVFGGNFGGTYP